MVIRELTYQLHKLEASESALVSADHHDKKSVLGIGGKNPDRSIPSSHCMKSTHSDLESAGACSFPRFNMKDKHCFESVLMIFMWICALS